MCQLNVNAVYLIQVPNILYKNCVKSISFATSNTYPGEDVPQDVVVGVEKLHVVAIVELCHDVHMRKQPAAK